LAWEPLYSHFGDRFRFIIWDYRSIFSSDAPKNPDDLTMDHHIHDIHAILLKEKVKKAMFGGWSMGVQVCLEIYKQHPELFRGIFLINGTFGNPFATAFNIPFGGMILPKLNEVAKRFLPSIQPHIQTLANVVLDTDGFVKLVIKLKLIHRNFDSEVFKKVAKEMIKTNFSMFHDILSHLAAHTAFDILKKIKVPTLIVAGSRDLFTPVSVAETMAAEIPNAELFVLRQGSHYCILEFPDIIMPRLEQFLAEHKLLPRKTARKKKTKS
jgi:3-oxoadipate enol-lactonase